MVKVKALLILLCSVPLVTTLTAQISSPGLGKANTAVWTAMGLRQALDSAGRRQSVSYLGMGRASKPSNYNPVQRTVLLVLNQEFYNQFHRHWQYSLALSYRRQNQYSAAPPYEQENPKYKQEFRVYGRYSYILKNSERKLVLTLRQELRKFVNTDFKNAEEDLQFRTRLRAQFTTNIGHGKTHKIILSTESLFAANRENRELKKWSNFAYGESRFCLYYSFSPMRSPFVFDVGYMNDLIGTKTLTMVHCLAIDVILENPFGGPKRKKQRPVENLE